MSNPAVPEESEGSPSVDTELLRGFVFDCRSDCGLCCYASPRVTARERDRLLRILPETAVVGSGHDLFLASRGEGGACQFLREHRCSVHALRPTPCREFPVTVHVGERLQATLALGCPGIDLGPLSSFPRHVADGIHPSLEGELASVLGRADSTVVGRVAIARRRRRRAAKALEEAGLWRGEKDVRDRLVRELPMPGPADFPVEDPPAAEDGIETLPMFFDERPGPVAIARGLGGWELRELSPSGRGSRVLGVVPPPEAPPRIDAAARERLQGYLAYWLLRDSLFGLVHLRVIDDGGPDVFSAVREELTSIGAQVLARAQVRSKLLGGTGDPLGVEDIDRGIQAYDLEGLDRPTWGDRL